MKINVIVYATSTGKKPFDIWFDDLDKEVQAIVLKRLIRVRLGNFGDCTTVKGSDLYELRFDFGPGYRIYFAKEGMTVVILLVGGDKKTQIRDIAKAKQYWEDYRGSRDD